jgi:serine/alanine adding enzyme
MIQVVLQRDIDRDNWDAYVAKHPAGTHCHLSAWKNIIEDAYGLQGNYLTAVEGDNIVGVLPLFFINSRLFGRQLVSMPFLNYGGILADGLLAAGQLHQQAERLLAGLQADNIEYRYTESGAVEISTAFHSRVNTNKVRMLLDLPDNQEVLFQSFRAKLRSQIKRPIKEGMECILGAEELLQDFYTVFSRNMRDLGSPVHSRLFFQKVMEYLGPYARIGVVYFKNIPVASGLIVRFGTEVEIPWASSLKKYNRLSPNMLLYWTFLQTAADDGFKYFDFGRSTEGEGTFRFKEQWGAQPRQLYWQKISRQKDQAEKDSPEKKSFKRDLVALVWRRLPLKVANYFGPHIRYKISL